VKSRYGRSLPPNAVPVRGAEPAPAPDLAGLLAGPMYFSGVGLPELKSRFTWVYHVRSAEVVHAGHMSGWRRSSARKAAVDLSFVRVADDADEIHAHHARPQIG